MHFKTGLHVPAQQHRFLCTTSTTDRFTVFLVLPALMWLLQVVGGQQHLYAQGGTTPTFTVDLTGKPNGVWTSNQINRSGQVCDAPSNQNCAEFKITLDRLSGGLQFDIIDGPVPSGSMAYQIDCGMPVPVGDSICVNGTEPVVLSICMPGKAQNQFRIRSIAAYNPAQDISVTAGCFGTLQAPIAFEEASLTWQDITGGGQYNSYLSCSAGCATPRVTPGTNPPAFVDYVVSGNSQASVCASLPYSDTVRVYFYPAPVVSIGPAPAIICPGASGVELTGNVTGGSGRFDYLWTDSNGQLLATTRTYTATAVGTYSLEVRNENYPDCEKFSSSITVVNDLSVNAGPDQLVCSQNNVNLAGAVTGASGGIWSGGSGTFSDNSALGAVYTPSPADLESGEVKLTLTTTGNGSCAPIQDEVLISFYAVDIRITGPAIICAGSTASLRATTSGGMGTVTYQWDTGETTAAISNKPAGTYTLTVSDGNSCAITKSFTVVEVAGPSSLTATLRASTCGQSNGQISNIIVSGGTAPYTYSRDGITFQSTASFSGLLAGTYSVTAKDANGCTATATFSLTDIPGPTAVAATALPASCHNNDGSITAGDVTGGTAPYTYSIDGSDFTATKFFTSLASGTYTLTVKDANGCIVSRQITVGKNVPTSFTSSTTSSTCGDSNGALSITGVTGGTAPYSYSLDGASFQSAAAFSGLAAASYTVTVKDANGCTYARQVQVSNSAGPTGLTAAITATTCGQPNGEITITGVAGGTAPYVYAVDGGSFQGTGVFRALAQGTYIVSVRDVNKCTYSEQVTVTNIAGPTALGLTAAASTCGNSNGSIQVASVTGGTAPYTYSTDGIRFQIAAAFNSLAAATYTITVRDANGCLVTEAVEITNIPGPADLSLTTTSSTCGRRNGTLEITGVAGGTAPYTFAINGSNFQSAPAFENILAGTYTVTVKDANGCTYAREARVANIAGPTDIAARLTATTCGDSNGQLTITDVTGGTAPYLYSKDGVNFQRSAVFTSLAAGQHTITAKDNKGCTFVKTFTITDIAGPTAVAATPLPATCADNDGSITAGQVTGGTAPYTYSIDGNSFQTGTAFTALAAGTYTLTVKDANGCVISEQVTVGKNVPTNFTSTTTSASCGESNGQLQITGVTGGTAPYTYSMEGGSFGSASAFTALAAGSYRITVKDANGCVYTAAVQVSNIAGPTFEAAAKVSTCGNSNGSMTVSNTTGGTAPYTYSLDGKDFQASTLFSGLSAGEYTLVAKDARGCINAIVVQLQDIAGPGTFELTTTATTCGNSNGSIKVDAVTGGTAPYTYALDGTSFRETAAFEGVQAGQHTITVRDANGCTVSQEAMIENIAGPDGLTASSTPSTCGQPNGVLEVTGVTGGSAPYNFSLDGAPYQNSTDFGHLTAGSHTLRVKDANGCTFAKTVTVSDVAGPTAVAATSQPATCADNDGSITADDVTGGTAPYTYSIDGSSFQTGTAFTALAAGTYTLTAKDANGCSVSRQITVGKNIPTSFTSSTTSSTCGDSNGALSITGVTGGTAPYTYSLDGASFQSAAAFSGLAAGAYTVTVKDANGCTFSAQVQVRDIPGPTGLTAAVKASTCGESNGQLSISSVSGGTAPYTYSLNGITFQSAASFSSLPAGTYTATVQDANGCTYAQEVTVPDAPAPTFAATPTASTCGNSNGQISVSNITGGTAPFAYSLDGKNFQTATTFPALAAGMYTLTVKDANGCRATKAVEITNIAGPTALQLTSAASTCGERNGSIQVASVTGGTAPYTYALNSGAYQSAATFEAVAAGEHTVTVKDANGCVLTERVTVSAISGITSIRATATASACSSATGSITVEDVNGGTAPYIYTRDGVNFQSSGTFTALAPGRYTVTVKDANNCSGSTSVTVGTNAPQEATLATTPSGCATNNGTLTVTGVTGGTAPFAYSLDGSTFQEAALFEHLATGSYTVTIRDAAGCAITRTQQVASTGGVSSITVTAADAGCGEANGRLSISNVQGGKTPYSYTLSSSQLPYNENSFQGQATFANLAAGSYQVHVRDAEGCVYTQPATVGGSAPLANLQVKVTPAGCGQDSGLVQAQGVTGGTGPYAYALDGINFSSSPTFAEVIPGRYTLTVKDAANCTITASVTVETASSTLGHATDVSCFAATDGQIAIAATGISDETTYSIDNGRSFHKSAVFSDLPTGVYEVITRFSPTCSIRVGTVELKGPEEIKATVTPLAEAIGQEKSGSAAVTMVAGGVAPYTYQLDGGGYTSATEFANLGGGAHTLLVKDANGCTAQVSFSIGAITDIEVPNGFTPNGDGLNDTWAIRNLALLYPRCTVTVYNRWGSPVFTSYGYTREWDGTINGKKLPDGTYYCIIVLEDGQPPLRKSLTIMR
ncbi:gliding motility-associated C-terminal domain-containing protein [Pontibacter sp. E15-1]|uniref:T9SS type B sorting domain-containing protein n=1 Tax=Pontibacter sp. E15-1 TaxID=2919918 RepID=UPI001F4F47C7|nr:gliding motility-associated C-terminal domain-containing protein [Pontibacter sp. E15-1]MCJ8166071.1 gliding motility-associated C-terminal domain-containing protein [Pontibacter sp. E15-1]